MNTVNIYGTTSPGSVDISFFRKTKHLVSGGEVVSERNYQLTAGPDGTFSQALPVPDTGSVHYDCRIDDGPAIRCYPALIDGDVPLSMYIDLEEVDETEKDYILSIVNALFDGWSSTWNLSSARSITELRALPENIFDTAMASTMTYHTSPGYGGGMFFWEPDSDKPDDNGHCVCPDWNKTSVSGETICSSTAALTGAGVTIDSDDTLCSEFTYVPFLGQASFKIYVPVSGGSGTETFTMTGYGFGESDLGGTCYWGIRDKSWSLTSGDTVISGTITADYIGAAAAGRLMRGDHRDRLFANNFGAVPFDNTVDSGHAVNIAMAAATRSWKRGSTFIDGDGGVVQLGGGKYYVATTIYNRSHVTLEGVSMLGTRLVPTFSSLDQFVLGRWAGETSTTKTFNCVSFSITSDEASPDQGYPSSPVEASGFDFTRTNVCHHRDIGVFGIAGTGYLIENANDNKYTHIEGRFQGDPTEAVALRPLLDFKSTGDYTGFVNNNDFFGCRFEKCVELAKFTDTAAAGRVPDSIRFYSTKFHCFASTQVDLGYYHLSSPIQLTAGRDIHFNACRFFAHGSLNGGAGYPMVHIQDGSALGQETSGIVFSECSLVDGGDDGTYANEPLFYSECVFPVLVNEFTSRFADSDIFEGRFHIRGIAIDKMRSVTVAALSADSIIEGVTIDKNIVGVLEQSVPVITLGDRCVVRDCVLDVVGDGSVKLIQGTSDPDDCRIENVQVIGGGTGVDYGVSLGAGTGHVIRNVTTSGTIGTGAVEIGSYDTLVEEAAHFQTSWSDPGDGVNQQNQTGRSVLLTITFDFDSATEPSDLLSVQIKRAVGPTEGGFENVAQLADNTNTDNNKLSASIALPPGGWWRYDIIAGTNVSVKFIYAQSIS